MAEEIKCITLTDEEGRKLLAALQAYYDEVDGELPL